MTRAALASTLVVVTALSTSNGASADVPPGDSGAASPAATDGLALALARLRGEIESLSDEIATIEQEERERRVTLTTLVTEARADHARASTKKARLVEERARAEQDARARAANEAAIAPAVTRILADLDAHIVAGLPYRVDERRRAVAEIDEGLKSRALTPRAALVRAWALVQDEDRLAGETVLDRQVVHVDGEDVHADVVRIGMTTLFFMTPDTGARPATLGFYVREGGRQDGAWTTRAFNDEGDRALVRALFEAQRGQVKTGLFALPVDMASLNRPKERASSSSGAPSSEAGNAGGR